MVSDEVVKIAEYVEDVYGSSCHMARLTGRDDEPFRRLDVALAVAEGALSFNQETLTVTLTTHGHDLAALERARLRWLRREEER